MGFQRGLPTLVYLSRHILVLKVVRGGDHPILSPGGVSSVQWVQVLPGDCPEAGPTQLLQEPLVLVGGCLSNCGAEEEHPYLVSRSCEFSSSRFPTSLPIPETKGTELLHVPGEARP